MRPIVVDLDGVLCEWNLPMWDLLKSCGAPMVPFELDGDRRVPRVWDWYARYGATPEALAMAHAHTQTNPQWWESLPAHEDFYAAVGTLGHLCTDPVYFVTARPHGTISAAVEWLGDYADFAFPNVIVTPTRKVPALIALEPRAIVEDNADTLRDYKWAMQSLRLPPCELILVDRPYNREGDLTGLTLVTSTHAALLVVKGLPRV